MSKLTSVEWLRDKIFEEFRFTFSDNILDEAKEMHRQEIINAGNSCVMKSKLYADKLSMMEEKELEILINKDEQTFGEDYYNETYKL